MIDVIVFPSCHFADLYIYHKLTWLAMVESDIGEGWSGEVGSILAVRVLTRSLSRRRDGACPNAFLSRFIFNHACPSTFLSGLGGRVKVRLGEGGGGGC